MNSDWKKIQEFITVLMTTAGFSLRDVEVKQEEEKTIKVAVFLDNAGLVIGENGENIFYWEEVLNQWARTHLASAAERIRVSLDINNYRWQNELRLRELAKKIAREVMMTKKEQKMAPMSSYERRIIHTELALHPGVVTESQGEGNSRQVVVKPL